MAAGRSTIRLVLFALLCLGLLVAIRLRYGGVAPTPHAFETPRTLDQALAASAESGKPVLAFATADWCGPCQTFKRGALADARVESWIAEHTIPVYVDLTSENDPEAQEASRLLSIYSVPALVIIRGGEVAGRLEGAHSAERVLEWLGASVSLAPAEQPLRRAG